MRPGRHFALRFVIAAAALAVLLQGFLWPRFRGVVVYDSDAEFNPAHHIETYFDDELDREVQISWSWCDLSESFVMQAASWEALDRDERKEIFVSATREACAA